MATEPLVSAGVWGTQVGGASAEDLSATADDYTTWCPGFPIDVTHFGFVVSTLVAADTTAPVVSLDRRPTVGDNTGRVEVDTVTIPEAAAPGKCYVVTLSPPLYLGMGEELVFEHKTQAADSVTPAGAGHYFVAYQTYPEIDIADTNYVAVA